MAKTNLPSPQAASIADRVLNEGAVRLAVAVRGAGLQGEATPSLKTLLRACTSGRLDAVKVAGRWLTSPAAVRRWIATTQRRRTTPPAPAARVDVSPTSYCRASGSDAQVTS